MNHLKSASSPYLQQHRDQPVEWYPWGEDAFAVARKDDRPILVSIGYSTCHWCHVMARESFVDKDVADYMNFHFVNIKIDREERPDLDAYFMDICLRLTGKSGWPLHVFLSPDLQPFFAGNYFPPDPDGRLMSWFQAMRLVVGNYRANREDIIARAQRILQHQEGYQKDPEPFVRNDQWLSRAGLQEKTNAVMQLADGTHGGFGLTPKFPNTIVLEFLLASRFYTGHESALRHVMLSVQSMLRGGIYDQAGGGLARYAVDRNWKTPHFEKMLYDQALLIQLLAHLIRHKPRRMYKRALMEMLAFVEREFSRGEGGWYAALDADYDGLEGGYYLWNYEEAVSCLPAESDWLLDYFDLHEAGNWDGRNILWQPHELYAFATDRGLEIEAAKESISVFKTNLLAARNRRSPLHRDEKVITDWNALMVSAYVQAGIALKDSTWIRLAIKHMNGLVLQVIDRDGHVRHLRTGNAPSMLSDHAWMIQALLEVYRVNQEVDWLDKAVLVMEKVHETFSIKGSPLYHSVSGAEIDELSGRVELRDEELPNANASLARSLYALGAYLGKRDWQKQSRDMLAAAWPEAQKGGIDFASWYALYALHLQGLPEIAVIGKEADEFRRQILDLPLPYCALASSRLPRNHPALLSEKPGGTDHTFIYLCQGDRCFPPVESMQQLHELLLMETTSGQVGGYED